MSNNAFIARLYFVQLSKKKLVIQTTLGLNWHSTVFLENKKFVSSSFLKYIRQIIN